MEPLMAYGGNNLINMVVSKIYTMQRSKFKGSGTSNGLAYTFDVTDPPVAALVANVASHNVLIDLKVAVTIKGGALDFNRTFTMTATGKIAIAQGILSLTVLGVTTPSANIADQLVAAIINSQIIPLIRSALAGIPIPQLTNLFGSGLSAGLRSGAVIAGPALEVGARITGKTGIAAADAPDAASIAALNSDTAADALVIATVSSAAVNVLIKALVPPLSDNFDERTSSMGFGAGIKGTIKATTPVLTVTNGTGEAATTISFANLKGGIDTPLTDWNWVSLPAPTARVVITHTLSTAGQTGVVTLTGVESIKVSFSFPAVLKPVEGPLEGLLNGIISLFRGRISDAVKGKKIELFRLPSTIPGTNLGATLSFDTGGLGYFKSSARASVRIRA